jgi:hypothetical protein
MSLNRTHRGRSDTRFGWLSTWVAGRALLLMGTGLMILLFRGWLVGTLAIAVGVWGLMYARRRFGPQ